MRAFIRLAAVFLALGACGPLAWAAAPVVEPPQRAATLPARVLAASIDQAAAALAGAKVKSVEFRAGVLKMGDKAVPTPPALPVPAPAAVGDPKLQQTYSLRVLQGAMENGLQLDLFQPADVGRAQSGLLRVDLRTSGGYAQLLRWLAAGDAVADSLVDELVLEPVAGGQVAFKARVYLGDRVLDLLAREGRIAVPSAKPAQLGRAEPFASLPAPAAMADEPLDGIEWVGTVPRSPMQVLAKPAGRPPLYALQVGNSVGRENARIVEIRAGEVVVELPPSAEGRPGERRTFAVRR